MSGIVKQLSIVLYLYTGVLLRNEKELTTDKYKIAKSPKLYVVPKKSETNSGTGHQNRYCL